MQYERREQIFDALRLTNRIRGDGSYCCNWSDKRAPAIQYGEGVEVDPIAYVAPETKTVYLLPQIHICHPELVDVLATAGWRIREAREVF